MPVPIRPIQDRPSDSSISPQTMDFSFLATQIETTASRRTVVASNSDAKLLFDIWLNSDMDVNGKFNISSQQGRDIMRLKSMGLVAGNNELIEFTKIGKIVITTMSLGEENKFKTKIQEKSYHEILASMSKRGKQGYRTPKYASSQSNLLRLDNGDS